MKRLAAFVIAASGAFSAGLTLAHAFPVNSMPHVGASIKASPGRVKIWFDADLEPLFDKLLVKDAQGQVVSQGTAQVDARDPALLEVRLPPALPPGPYHVYWQVNSRDGHRTQGDFTFTVQPAR
ncbi:MAG: copper resistance protein CopC [Xanthomonadaceae bacterium]|nr:copper resistance protein CopC [Xanthomonadaceae bacterium]